MTNPLPNRDELVDDLTAFVQAGYRIGEAETSLESLNALTKLNLVGGPDRPQGVVAWRERQESIRSVLRDIAENEVCSTLGDEYAEVTIRLFRLDKARPMDRLAHGALNKLQDDLGETFGVRRRVFVEKHRLPILEVVADALIQREEAVRPPGDLAEPEVSEEPAPDPQEDLESAPMADPADEETEDDEEIESPSDAEPQERPDPQTAPAEDAETKPPEQEPLAEPAALPAVSASNPSLPVAQRSGKPSRTALSLIGIVALIGVAAVVLLVVRSQSSESNQGDPGAVDQAQTSPSPAATAPSENPSNAPTVPPIDFTAEVVNWCYCGDLDTLESQIKIKPRFVNHSTQRVDLRTGGSARLGLAFYAKATSDRSWITPTEPRYRRYGKWIVVPPNAPGDLTSPTMFETHWEPTSLRPFGEYLDADYYEGDLVFNVPPGLVVGGYRVRLAYRLHSGDLYFPRKGAAGQWHGYRKKGSTF